MTVVGIPQPKATFSACFGAPFLPLNPTTYAEMLGKKIEKGSRSGDGTINVWLINTGWTGGAYGEGSRIELSYTRAMIKAAITGELNKVDYINHPIFGMAMPTKCPDVPNAILNPRDTWRNEEEYDKMAQNLAELFTSNFEQYKAKSTDEIINAGPVLEAVQA